MRLTAHRGFAGVEPENTLTAVRRAASIADEIEIDVRRCGSGELVVIHDETVDRVTDGTGRVDDYALTELRELSVLDSHEAVPTLRSVVETVPPELTLNVELKEVGIAEDAAEITADSETPVLFSSFLSDAIERVPEGYPTALIFDEEPGANVKRAARLGCERVHPHWWLALRSRLVERANERGMAVHTWTIERQVTARVLGLRGVDGVIADEPVL